MKSLRNQLIEKMEIRDMMENYIDVFSKVNYDGFNRYDSCTMEEFCDKNDIDIEYITDDEIDAYYKCEAKINYNWLPMRPNDYRNRLDWILESLTSHGKDKLKNQLNDVLSGVFHEIGDNTEKHGKQGIIYIDVAEDCEIVNDIKFDDNTLKYKLSNCKLSNKIYDILEFFNYYITLIYKFDNIVRIQIEPKYTELVNDIIKKNGNIVYHVTSKDTLPEILRKGLRPKIGSTYRYFTERLFVICNNPNIKRSIINVIKDKELFNNYVILKIDLKNRNINFWWDDASKNNYDMYTMQSIPPKMIEVVDLENL